MLERGRVLMVCVLLAACGDDGGGDGGPSASGPGGAYDIERNCAPYSTNGGPAATCANERYHHLFQCDAQPGDPCDEAPEASPDPDQTWYCCDFSCARDEDVDHLCSGGRHAYGCDSDASLLAESYGCEAADATYICC